MYLIFDTETTGIPKRKNAPIEELDNWPRIVQIAWLTADEKGREIENASGNYIIKPDNFIIPEKVSLIHGITTERALAEGENAGMVFEKFCKVLNSQFINNIVGHNIEFDINITASEFYRHNLDTERLLSINRICTMKSSIDFCNLPNNKYPRLSELYKKIFNKNLENAHDAMADIKACKSCLFELKNKAIIKSRGYLLEDI